MENYPRATDDLEENADRSRLVHAKLDFCSWLLIMLDQRLNVDNESTSGTKSPDARRRGRGRGVTGGWQWGYLLLHCSVHEQFFST